MCLNAYPSPRQVLLGDRWLLRIAGGATRRTNAVSPLRADHYDPTPVIEQARALYRVHRQLLVFRVPSIADGMDAPLMRAGFVASGDVSTLLARLDECGSGADPQVDLAERPSEDWLAAKFRMTPKVGAAPEIYRAMVASIALPTAFAAVLHEGRIVSVAFGGAHDGIVTIESVVTDPADRRRGYGRRLVGTLLSWARTKGAELACLQVEADNAPAVALYRSLGFRTEIYRYHYRSEL